MLAIDSSSHIHPSKYKLEVMKYKYILNIDNHDYTTNKQRLLPGSFQDTKYETFKNRLNS